MGEGSLYHVVFSDILYLHCLSAANMSPCAAVVQPTECTTDRVHFGCNKVVKYKRKNCPLVRTRGQFQLRFICLEGQNSTLGGPEEWKSRGIFRCIHIIFHA